MKRIAVYFDDDGQRMTELPEQVVTDEEAKNIEDFYKEILSLGYTVKTEAVEEAGKK